MAATNYTPIQLYYSTTASAAPTAGNLVNGELAINITDGKLYYKDNGGVVQVIATKGAGTIGGSNTQIQFNDGGALAGNAAMVFNKATNVTTLTTLNLTNALGATYGGTAQSAYAQGDLLYASAVNTLSKLSIGTVNYILTSTGSVPQWVAPTSVTVQTANNLAGGAAGSVPYQSAADTTTFLSIGAANRVMTSTGSAPQWVTSLTGLTGVSSSSITNTGLTSGRVVYSGASGVQTDSANLTFNGTTLSAGGFSTTGNSTLVKLVTIGDSGFTTGAVLAAATPAKLYIGTGAVTDGTSAGGATNTLGAVTSFGQTQVIATNANVTYTNLATLYIAGTPTAGTNVTITNPYSLYIAGGASYFGGALTLATALSTANGGTGLSSFTAGDLVYYASGTAFTKLGIGTNGQILTSTGTAPQWSTLSGVAVTTFSAGTTGFTPSSATSGAVTLAGTLATTNGGTGLTTFTANQVFYASSTSAVAQSANLTFDGTTLTAANFADSSLTSGRVTYAGASGNLTDSGNLVFSGNQLSVQNTAAATGPSTPSYALSAISSNNLILNLTANGEAYTLNTASSRYLYYQAGTVVSIGTNYVSGSGTAALIDFNAYNSGGSATDLYLGAVSGANANGAAIFVLGRRTGATSWAESLRIDENGGLSTTPAANGNTVFNENGVDSDFRVESDAITHMLFVDAGNNTVGIGTNITDVSSFGLIVGSNTTANEGSISIVRADYKGSPADIGPIAWFRGGDASERGNPVAMIWGRDEYNGGAYNGTLNLGSQNANTLYKRLSIEPNEAVFNQDSYDYDFRVESDLNTHMLFVDGGNDAVGIGMVPLTTFGNRNSLEIGGNTVANLSLQAAIGETLYNFYINGSGQSVYANDGPAGFQSFNNAVSAGWSFQTYPSGTAGGLAPAGTDLLALSPNGTIFNEGGADIDFRVESDANTHMLFVDAGNNGVNIGNNGAVPPVSGLRVAGATNPAGGIVGVNQIIGYVASNYSGTRYWVLHVMDIGGTKQQTAFNCMGDVHASSYTTWNLSNLYIRREYDTYNVFGSITGVIKSSVTVSIVDISYNSNRYIAIKFAGGDPGIEANLIGYLMNQQYTNGTDAFFINGTAGVTENAVIASY